MPNIKKKLIFLNSLYYYLVKLWVFVALFSQLAKEK